MLEIVFGIGSQFLFVEVAKDRVLSMKGPMTNNVFVTLEELGRLSGQNNEDAVLTQNIVRDLKSLGDVERYVINEFMRGPEMQKLGIRHVKTVRQDC